MHATAIVTDAVVTRNGPAAEGFRDGHPSDMFDLRIEYADPAVRRARSAFADGNVDRRVESTKVDIPARHPRDANVDPVATCRLDAR